VLRAPVLLAGAQAFVANAAIFAIWLLAPFYLQASRGLPVLEAGLLFTLTPLGTTLAAPVAGRLADRVGVRGPVVAGLAVEALGLLLMSRAGPDTPLPLVGAALLAAGFGVGLFQVTNMTQIMAAFASAQQGAAGGFAFLSRTLGVVAGVAVLAQLFALRRVSIGLGPAAAEAFFAAGVTVALAAIASLARAR
jgi:MFS family permease